MEPESHDAAQSRRYEAAESMLQHARMPRTQQSALNGFPKAYPLGSDSSQQLNHRPAVPLTPYPDYTMAIHHPRAGQAPVYNPLSDARLDSPQDASPQHDQHDRHVLVGQQHAYATVSSDNDIRQLTSRGLHTQHDPVKQSNIAEDGEPRSPVSSRGIAAKESATRKRSMRTLGQKAGKKDSALKQEGDNPPPWSELKTKAGKERKRLPLACIACRRKKIRCSGERPACKHCFRSRTPCVYKVTPRKAAPRTDYMAMLDKRLKRMEERVIRLIPEDRANGIPATGRAQVRPLATGLGNKAQGAKKRAAGEAFGPDLEAWATSRVSKPSTQGRGTGQTTPPAEGSDRLPSKEIQEHLADVYFECLYGQSYLLLHKPSFMKRLRYVMCIGLKLLTDFPQRRDCSSCFGPCYMCHCGQVLYSSPDQLRACFSPRRAMGRSSSRNSTETLRPTQHHHPHSSPDSRAPRIRHMSGRPQLDVRGHGHANGVCVAAPS